MFKKVLLTSILTIAATTTFAMADGDKKVTSKNYVDTAVATRQEKITAGTTGNVVTYNGTTNGQAQFSERGITDEFTDNTNPDDLVTVEFIDNEIYNTYNLKEQWTQTLSCHNPPDCTLYDVLSLSFYARGDSCETASDCTCDVNMDAVCDHHTCRCER